jgi:Sulfotransferase family
VTGHFAAQEQRLHEQAIAATGLSDFGDPVYCEGLRQLLAAYDANGVVYPDAGAAVLGPIGQRLAARLRSLDQIKRLDPALSGIAAPIFILGLPRTGTTALQRLLMADPQLQGLEYWLGENPRPRPQRERWEDYAEFRQCRDSLAQIAEFAPAIDAMHPMRADAGEECRLVMEQSFGHSSFSLVSPLRPYQDWLFAADLAPHYRHFAAVLRLIGSPTPDKPWVLKCPHHAPQVDSLLRAFPDARIVLMHRPVEELVPSVARLAEAFLGMVEGPGIDMAARAAMIVDNLDLTLRRLLAVRAAQPGRFLDVAMDRFVADPLATVRTIYDRFGLMMTGESEEALTGWIGANGRHGGGAATGGELPFGLNRDTLRERFAYYRR